jgi:hypothetical protein
MTQYAEWLATLGGLRADLPPCVRGLAVSHTLTYPGNVTTATLAGSVKASPDATSELAVFTIGTPAFADGVTTWTFGLAAGSGSNATGNSALQGSNPEGVDVWIYDLLLTLSGGSAQRIAGGLFPISGFVTEPA